MSSFCREVDRSGIKCFCPKTKERELALLLLISLASPSDVTMKVTTRVALRCHHVNHESCSTRLKQRTSKDDLKSFAQYFHRMLTSKPTSSRNDPTQAIFLKADSINKGTGGEKKNIDRKVREEQRDKFQTARER